jgi:hypothetical protein
VTTLEPEGAYVRITMADLHRALTRVESEVLRIALMVEAQRNQTLDHEGRLRLVEERRLPLPLVPVVSALVALSGVAVAVLALVNR